MWDKGRTRKKDEEESDEGTQDQGRAQATVVTSETSSAAGSEVLLGTPLGVSQGSVHTQAPALRGLTQQGCRGLQQSSSRLPHSSQASSGSS